MTIVNTKYCRDCKQCGSEIPTKAKICPECGSYKSAWKNHLRYWSGVIGLFVFIGSATVYISNTLWDWKARLFGVGSDLKVLNLNTYGQLSVRNYSPFNVLINDLIIKNSLGGEESYMFGKVIEPGKSLSENMIEIWNIQTHKDSIFYRHPPGAYAFSLTPEQIEDIKGNIHPSDFSLAYLNSSGSDYKIHIDTKKSYNDLGCEATLSYSVFRGRTIPINVPCIAWARRIPKKEKK